MGDFPLFDGTSLTNITLEGSEISLTQFASHPTLNILYARILYSSPPLRLFMPPFFFFLYRRISNTEQADFPMSFFTNMTSLTVFEIVNAPNLVGSLLTLNEAVNLQELIIINSSFAGPIPSNTRLNQLHTLFAFFCNHPHLQLQLTTDRSFCVGILRTPI